MRGLTESLRMELLDTNVQVHCVHPGGIKTNIATNSRIVANDDPIKAKELLDKFNKNALVHTPEKAAAAIIKGIINNSEKIMIGPETYLADFTIKVLPTSYSKLFSKIMNRTL